MIDYDRNTLTNYARSFLGSHPFAVAFFDPEMAPLACETFDVAAIGSVVTQADLYTSKAVVLFAIGSALTTDFLGSITQHGLALRLLGIRIMELIWIGKSRVQGLVLPELIHPPMIQIPRRRLS